MNKLNVLITGANGQLGSEIRAISADFNSYQFFFTDIAELDITNELDIQNYLVLNNIRIIVNCAAYTAVDKAESDFDNACAINIHAVKKLAKTAESNHALLIHISSDYVYDGMMYRPYTESDSTNPQSKYGISKLKGELEAILNNNRSVIIRTSWLYSSFGNNFVKTIIAKAKEKGELMVVYDQIGTPTYARDLACAILTAIPGFRNIESPQIYNYSNEGAISWFDFAQSIIELKKIKCKIKAVESVFYPTPAKRPSYSVLNKSKFKQSTGISIPYWKDSLKQCLNLMND